MLQLYRLRFHLKILWIFFSAKNVVEWSQTYQTLFFPAFAVKLEYLSHIEKIGYDWQMRLFAHLNTITAKAILPSKKPRALLRVDLFCFEQINQSKMEKLETQFTIETCFFT